MLRLWLLPIVILISSGLGICGPDQPKLPSKFAIKERVLAWVSTFEVQNVDGGSSLGTVRKKILSVATQYEWRDPQGVLLATGRRRLFSWGSVVDVMDPSGVKLGTIREEVLKSLFKAWTTYQIQDANGRQIASSEKTEWLSTKVVVMDPRSRVCIRLVRPAINLFSDRWTAEMGPGAEAVDVRILVMIAVFKTDMDNQRRQE